MYIFGSAHFITEVLVSVLITTLLGCYLYFQYCFTYWKKRGIPTLPPSFPFGNLGVSGIGLENLFVRIHKLHIQFKEAGYKHAGIYFFNGPVYVPIDPDVIKTILITDFDHFVDRGAYYDEHKYPLSGNIASLRGDRWKEVRSKMTPGFTSGKLKQMYPYMFMPNAANLVRILEPIARNGGKISTRELFKLYTGDIISCLLLGFQYNLLDNPDQELAKVIAQLLQRPWWIKWKTMFTEGLSDPGKLFKTFCDNDSMRMWLGGAMKHTIKYRQENKVDRKDFFDILMNIEGLSWDQKIAQIFILFAAGHDTSAGTMSGCMYELARHPDIQDKLREEIYKHLGKDFREFTYDKLLSLSYLDNVLKETMRMYPAVGIINRVCVKDYTIPGTDIVLEEGTPVIVSTLGLHRDPDYFLEPLKFDPDRFNDPVVPFSYMPFGDGPRMCLGMRFGMLQVKLGVAAILSKFRISPADNVPKVLEFEKIPGSPALLLDTGLIVKLEEL